MKPPLDRIGWGRKGVDSLHFGTIGEGPSIVSKIDPRLKIKGIFGVASHPKIFVEAMMGRAIEKGLGESGTKILATLKSFALGGKGDGLDGRSGWSNGGAYRPHR